MTTRYDGAERLRALALAGDADALVTALRTHDALDSPASPSRSPRTR